MPITSFDIPQDQLDFIDELVKSGVVRNRREAVVQAIQKYREYDIWKWNTPFLIWRSFRRAMITKRGLELLTEKMSDEELYAAGRRMGKTVNDSMIVNFGREPNDPENLKLGLNMLEQCGIGQFQIENNTLIIRHPFFPKEMLRGYLETAFFLSLKPVSTLEDIAVMKIEKEIARKQATPKS